MATVNNRGVVLADAAARADNAPKRGRGSDSSKVPAWRKRGIYSPRCVLHGRRDHEFSLHAAPRGGGSRRRQPIL